MSEHSSLDEVSNRLREGRRLLVLLIVALLTTLLVADYNSVPTEPVSVGEVAERTVKAPFAFTYQDLSAYEAARERAEGSALPRFSHDDRLLMQTALGLSQAFENARSGLAARSAPPEEGDTIAVPSNEAMEEVVSGFVAELGLGIPAGDLLPLATADFPPDAETLVLRWLDEAYGDQLVLRDRSELPDSGPINVVPSSEPSRAFQLSDRARLTTPNQIRRSVTLAALSAKRKDRWSDAAETLALALVKPNLSFDELGSNEARAVASAAVPAEPITVQRGEILFREGDLIGARQAAMYGALQRSSTDNGVALELLTLFSFLLMLMSTLYVVAREQFLGEQGLRDLAATGGLIVLSTFSAKVVVVLGGGVAELVGNEAQASSVWYMAPIAGSAMLARIIMNREMARYVVLVSAAAASIMMNLDAVYVLFFLITGIVGSATIGGRHERVSVLRAGLITGGFGALMVLLVHFLQLYVGEGVLSLATTIRPVWSMMFAFVGGVLSSFVLLAMVPIFEWLGFVTDYRMLELASLNHPLMKKLMLSAPGTYHHSVVVGTLAEAACEAIGANGLQAKIAAYFHDIGKALKPTYFVENQRGGVNKHDDLDPVTSAHIIISHVTEGAKMAREEDLPKPIIDNILMHHGTGLLQFFFAKAQMEADDPASVDESLFRYPGPRPNTREAGVVMLADKVEAATRTIQKPTEENIRAMINRIINSVMADDQFRECPLTFREIYTIADTFVRVLMGIYHQRIEYPPPLNTSGKPSPMGGRAAAAKPPGTITLDLERPPEPEQLAGSALWNEDSLADDDDYEAVHNLPRNEK